MQVQQGQQAVGSAGSAGSTGSAGSSGTSGQDGSIHSYSGTASKIWTVNHNMGVQAAAVTVFDSNYKVIYP